MWPMARKKTSDPSNLAQSIYYPIFFKKNSTPANQNWQTRIPFFKIVEITLYHPLVGRLAFSHPLKKRQDIIAHLTGG
jgi:hypothetical protein